MNQANIGRAEAFSNVYIDFDCARQDSTNVRSRLQSKEEVIYGKPGIFASRNQQPYRAASLALKESHASLWIAY